MKKILIIFIVAIVCVSSTRIFAEEQEISNDNATIELIAEKTSTYTIKLPMYVDVSSQQTKIDIYVKGDVDDSKKIEVSENNNETHYLINISNKDIKYELLVTGSSIEGKDILAQYDDNSAITLTINHDEIAAGSYSCSLPILIKLIDV